MIVCPNCRQTEIFGALFCDECGEQLVTTNGVQTHVIGEGKIDRNEQKDDTSGQNGVGMDDLRVTNLALVVVESGQIIHLTGRMDYTLGRAVEEQPILPDVDFSAFDAHRQGVSRLHASLKWIRRRVYIMDLGSSNGTQVNGRKTTAHVDYPVKDGDIITLGRLKIQIMFQKLEENR